MEIRILSKQGKGVREISRITGHSRNTIRKLLRSAAEPAYKERAPRTGKLDPFKSFLEERLKAALPHRLPATVLTREIKALGFDGWGDKGTPLKSGRQGRQGDAPGDKGTPLKSCVKRKQGDAPEIVRFSIEGGGNAQN